MKLANIGVVLGLAACVLSVPAVAGEHRKGMKESQRVEPGMQAVLTNARRGESGFGWRYFTDAREGRAVVISPRGEYFYGDGKGLKLVFGSTAAS
jgi:hypothetical protein